MSRLRPGTLLPDERARDGNRVYAFGPFRLEVAERRLLNEARVVPLTVKEFDLLLAMVEAAGHLKTRDELVSAVWPHTIVEEHSLTSRISSLRKALQDEGETPRYIETVRGRGYRFIAAVTANDMASVTSADPGKVRRPARSVAVATLVLAAAGCILAWRYLGHPSMASGAPTQPSIAVLPLENLSADAANAYFVSGIRDMIVAKLGGLVGVRVISRTSSAKYPSHPDNTRDIGHELGVATVLEGSVQKLGDEVLISLQLIEVDSDRQLWAQTYSRRLDNVFDVESDVAGQVAAALKAKLLPAEARRLATEPTRNGQAYDLFLQAEYLALQVEEGGTGSDTVLFGRAAELYRRALEHDPDFALAKARLSFLESYAYWFGLDPEPSRLAAAEQHAKEALASGEPQAHIAMGYVHYWGHRDYAKALAEFEQAEISLPNDAAAVSAAAFIDRRQGKWQEALSALRQAELRDPRNALWFNERAGTFAQLRCYAEAEEEYDRALAIDPSGHRNTADRALTYLLAGRPRLATEALRRIPSDASATSVVVSTRFRAAMVNRDPDAALAALPDTGEDWLEEPFKSSVPVVLLRAQALALKGDNARAHAEYEKARASVEENLRAHPENFNLLNTLGSVLAGLGETEAAVASSRRATELMPIAADAMSGTSQLVMLAENYAQVGDAESATALLRRLLAMPAGMFVSAPLLRDDPIWDRIRADPRFQALLAEDDKQRANSSGISVTSGSEMSAPVAAQDIVGEAPLPSCS